MNVKFKGKIKMKILNLFAGIGGNRTLWGDEHEITAIEHNKDIAEIYMKRFPNDETLIGDAYGYLESQYKRFDFIWASPPCITHTRMVAFPSFKPRLPDLRLYSIIIFLQRFFRGKWVVENVISHYEPIVKPTALIDRHYFWSNLPLKNKKFQKPSGNFKDLPKEILCSFLYIDESLIENLPSQLNGSHDNKRKVLRNCVIPEVGKYVLDSINIPTLDNYL